MLTTPNIAFLFRRLRVFIGIQPQYITHVREYNKRGIEELLKRHGFKILESKYSEINDLTLINAKREEYSSLKTYWDLVKITIRNTIRNPTKLNMLRTLAYPLIKLIPTLRTLIVMIAEKSNYPKSFETER